MSEIAEVILSWPTACIVALLVLRKPISALIHRLIRSDSGGFGGVFSEEQNREMKRHIDELTRLTTEAEQSLAAYGDYAAAEG